MAGAPLAHNNDDTMGMDRIDRLFARTSWFSHPDFAIAAFLERRAPSQLDRTDARAELRGLSLVTPGPWPVRATMATTADEVAAATGLVESRYAWRGYTVTPNDGAAATTLVAKRDKSAVVGTLTLRIDGAAGLAADESYGAVIDAARASGRRVCELTRLAIDTDAAWRPTLGALIGLAYLTGRAIHEVTDVFVEVNPRHVRFYQRMFGFVVTAGQRLCPRVRAPAVLLRLELDRFEAFVQRVGEWSPAFAHAKAAA